MTWVPSIEYLLLGPWRQIKEDGIRTIAHRSCFDFLVNHILFVHLQVHQLPQSLSDPYPSCLPGLPTLGLSSLLIHPIS